VPNETSRGKGQTLLAPSSCPECQVPGDTLVATRPSVAPPEVSEGLQWSAMPGDVTAASMTAEPGLGTTLVKALAQDLDAKVEVVSGPGGANVSLTHAAFPSRLAQTA
jgi:hypothetical protein